MIDNTSKIKNKKTLSAFSQNLYLIILAFMLFLSGVIGTAFWKIEISVFSKFLNNKVKNNSVELDQNLLNSDSLKLNKKSLSSSQIFDTNIAIAWSDRIFSNVDKGIALPRLFLSQLPNDLDKYEPVRKKKLFTSILLPIVLRANEIVLKERKSMEVAFLQHNIVKIKYFAERYKVNKLKEINFYNMSSMQIILIKDELLKKINRIPISMMLSQAAIESGWGSSRFAREGNALFGEWTWKNNSGLKPRDNLNANFSVKSFKNISESVNSYMLNLNSHPAYKEMRNYRSLILKDGKSLVGSETANYLDKYAETGLKYVVKVTSLIKSNKFNKFDNIKLEINEY